MAYPKYLVSYITMDSQVGSNIIWHAALLLSVVKAPDEPIEVIDCYGFYSQKSSSTNLFVRCLKKVLGIGFDLTGAHGVLKREALRFLDKGIGIEGLSFKVSEKQFELLIRLCQEEITIEQQAICEIEALLVSEGVKKDTITAYHRYNRELLLAESEGRESRFSHFNLQLAIKCGLSTANSHTCKSHAIGLLAKIGIAKEYLDSLKQNTWAAALPRFSGKLLTPMHFYSQGPKESHVSPRTGKITIFRKWAGGDHYDIKKHKIINTSTQLFMTHPPDFIIGEDGDPFCKLLTTNSALYPLASKKIQELQQIETLLLNSETAARQPQLRDQFIMDIRTLYQGFSLASSNQDLRQYDPQINKAKVYIENLYDAIIEEKRAEESQSSLESHAYRLPLSDLEKNKLANCILKRQTSCQSQVITLM